MANPQNENKTNNRKSANIIFDNFLDALIRHDLSKRQMKIIIFIFRLSNASVNGMANVPKQKDFAQCGVGKTHIGSELAMLIELNVVTLGPSDGEYAINLDFESWASAVHL